MEDFHIFVDVVIPAESIEDAKWRFSQFLTNLMPSTAKKLYDIKGDVEVHPASKCAEYNW